MKKVLTILGTTASGKTALAIKLSKTYSATLISADSRQVYRNMDIVTGKDHPKEIPVNCIDVVGPDEEFSVAHWLKCAIHIVEIAHNSIRLPIILGGTGLYIDSLTKDFKNINVPPNPKLRASLADKPIEHLQKKLASLDHSKFTSMNNSDVNNKRRLIRAIEVASSQSPSASTIIQADFLHIVLIPVDLRVLEQKIHERVKSRIQEGAIQETEILLANYPLDTPSFTSLGYKHLIAYLRNEITMDKMIDEWTHDELSYAKRQITWFKKMPNAHIFDPYNSSTAQNIVKLVNTWYIGE